MVQRLFAVGLLALALVVTGCGGGKKTERTLSVTAEQQGSELKLRFETTNFEVGKDGHIHVRINGGPEAMVFAYTYTVPDLAPGRYEIETELSNAKHVNLGIKRTITVEMKP